MHQEMSWHTAFRISHQVNHDFVSIEMNMFCAHLDHRPLMLILCCVCDEDVSNDFVNANYTLVLLSHVVRQNSIWSCECSFWTKFALIYTYVWKHTHTHYHAIWTHQCILWMTHAHSYTRCGSFFNASTIILRLARHFKWMRWFCSTRKQCWRSLVHLLHIVVSPLLQTLHGCRDARISDPKACARKHAPHHPIAHTMARPGHVLRQVETTTTQTHWYSQKCIIMRSETHHKTILWYMLWCILKLWIIHTHTHTHGVDVWSMCGVSFGDETVHINLCNRWRYNATWWA